MLVSGNMKVSYLRFEICRGRPGREQQDGLQTQKEQQHRSVHDDAVEMKC